MVVWSGVMFLCLVEEAMGEEIERSDDEDECWRGSEGGVFWF